MKLTIFGATGATGTELARQALEAGHEVTAVVRDPGRMSVPAQSRLNVITADVMDPASISPAVAGADAVITAIAPHGLGRSVLRPRPCGAIAVITASASATAGLIATGSMTSAVITVSRDWTGTLIRPGSRTTAVISWPASSACLASSAPVAPVAPKIVSFMLPPSCESGMFFSDPYNMEIISYGFDNT